MNWLFVIGTVCVVLKLAGLVRWEWVWVLSPFWIWLILCVGVIVYGVGKAVLRNRK